MEWDRLGAPVELLTAQKAKDLIGTDAFVGALLDHRAGTINPMGYCRGLARVAKNKGAKISTNTSVTGLLKESNRWRIITSKGDVIAKWVVLGTNAYTDDLWPNLKKTYTKIDYFNCATAPLGKRIKSILPKRQGLWDNEKIMFSLRRDKYDRLIIGSMGNIIGGLNNGITQRWASKKLSSLFPDLGKVEFEEAWHGQIALTPTHLPHLHVLDNNLYAPIGYNGRGITTGTIFGKAIAEIITGCPEEMLPMPLSKMKNVLAAPLMSKFYKLIFATNQVLTR